MNDIIEEAIQELFIALSTRWRRPDGTLGIGVQKERLLQVKGVTQDALETLIQKLRERLSSLGLDLVEFYFEGEHWYAIRSIYASPNELDSMEEGVLAVIICLCEKKKEPIKAEVLLTDLKRRVVEGKYLTQYQLDRVLHNLEYLGYIRRTHRGVRYFLRTLLEFSDEARKHIAEESERLVF